MSARALWHDLECGAYRADLPLWCELASEASGPVLELGCGTGRVTLELAARGIEVTGVDVDPALVAALLCRAEQRGLDVEAPADARDLTLRRHFALVLAPMQFVHLLGGEAGRRSMLGSARDHLDTGGRLATAVLSDGAGTSTEATADDGGPAPLPDVREQDGWVYSSLPLAVERRDGTLEVSRLRQTVSPQGELSDELDVTRLDLLGGQELEAEAAAEGLRAVERLEVPATEHHVGSTVIVMEAR